MSFGRKGLAASEPMTPMAMRSVAPPPVGEAPMSPALAAFLAAERQRAPSASPAEEASPARRATGVRADDPHPLGAQLVYPRDPRTPNQRSVILAYAIWCFFSHWGGHRHYLGARTSGSVMALLAWTGLLLIFLGRFDVGIPILMLFGLWAIIDLFLIPGLARKANTPASDAA